MADDERITEADVVKSDEAAVHEADKMPSEAEERLAEAASEELEKSGESGEVAQNYKEAIERGAALRGEGEIS